jgi:hypothetical protein
MTWGLRKVSKTNLYHIIFRKSCGLVGIKKEKEKRVSVVVELEPDPAEFFNYYLCMISLVLNI